MFSIILLMIAKKKAEGSENGWVKLHRSLLDNGWLKNHGLYTFWSYCLLKASHKQHQQMVGFQKVTLQPGQFIFGRKKAAEDLNTTESKIRTLIKSLKENGSIAIESTNAFSIITVSNWVFYQSSGKESDQHIHQQTASASPANNHKQEVKKERMQNNKKDMGIAEEKAQLEPVVPVKVIMEQYIQQEQDTESKRFAENFMRQLKQHEPHPQQEKPGQREQLKRKPTPNNLKDTINKQFEKMYPDKGKSSIPYGGPVKAKKGGIKCS